ncbi:hypothetical protein DPEC_G00054660 [Dallia pectoralis]|uniref:Uncharacterized protein n=1 Tax=Dallia pectoralis TaxID=75939 RepID=A0ACC2H547_DALPE|nr:hypothetical protein DPEC_G00054660 [Dallia pectoralis]
MASDLSFEEDLSCPVCCDIFKDPVMMVCGHSFCKICLQKSWKEKKYRECPLCRSKSSNTEPAPNRNLRSLCETFLKPHLDGPTSSKRCKTSPETLCHLHCEKFKLFCLDDNQPICVVCRDSRNHKGHNCRPVDEMVQDCKVDLNNSKKLLKEKLAIYSTVKRDLYQRVEQRRNQVQSTERQINEEFETLHQFLRDEKLTRIAALREEEEQNCQEMKTNIIEIRGKISSISETLREIEVELSVEDISFVKNYKTTMARAQVPLPDPPPVSAPQIDVAKHLDHMSFRVWEKMRTVVKCVPVSLDANFANPCFTPSDAVTCGMLSSDTQQPSNNTESIDDWEWELMLLGSEVITSGTVDVNM